MILFIYWSSPVPFDKLLIDPQIQFGLNFTNMVLILSMVSEFTVNARYTSIPT